MKKRTRIEIRYPEDRMQENRARLEAVERFEPPDRVPVVMGACARYGLDLFGMTYPEYFSDPRVHMFQQLRYQKWLIEELGDDRCVEPKVMVTPDFENLAASSACGCSYVVEDDIPPWAQPCLYTPEDVHRFESPKPTAGLWGKRFEWYERMLELRNEFEVIFNGEEIEIEVFASAGGESPFMVAMDAVGEPFLLWILEQPEVCHELMGKITEGFIAAEKKFRELRGVPIESGYMTSDDSAIVISLDQYREICVPYTGRLYDTFSGDGMRLMHLCGRMMHLAPALLEDLRVTHLQGYGFQNRPEELASTLAGKMVLMGNLNPLLLRQGPVEEIRAETLHLLETLAPFGGIMVTDGYNLVPGTPTEHIAAVVDACREFGRP